ncbi:protein-cysteine N-palmitoyltransferase Rasp [Chelonus insularis]|uniref:protein-cysteine N-palmitoyltransferase Rasp n=1 Tax=Chelonus insularis TaxID=460826 RepID=UPI00158CFFEB|nr:protein-cysteine N-palmitoyltransferase Rasp [Chelonus insularis]
MTHEIKLPKYEVVFYFIVWTSGVLYSLYHLYLAGSYFDYVEDRHGDFAPGWSWIERKQDISDDEWIIWIPLLKRLIPWLTAHLLIAQLMKYYKFNSTVICSWYIFITSMFLYNYFGVNGMIIMFIQPSLSCLLISIGSIPFAYYILLGCIIFAQVTSAFTTLLRDWANFDDKQYYMMTVSIFWVQLRCICCTVDEINNYKHQNIQGFLKNLIRITAYYFYLPTLLLGPFFLYSNFIKGVNEPFNNWTLKRSLIFIKNMSKYVFWIFFTELSLHFIYCNAFRYHPKVVSILNGWAFHGLGYSMGQYFCNKYIIVYGISGEISRADNIDAPPPPKCIGRIHLYSDMWKHFDRGLYQFLVRYIYGPIVRLNIPLSRIVASFLSFSFIYVWHGLHQFVLMWSSMNFLGIVIENVGTYISNTSQYVYCREKILSEKNIRRFNCLVAAPLLAMSAVSNFYFFGGMKIGNLFIYRLFYDSWTTIITRILILYCCCQVSTEMKRFEIHKSKKISF